MVYTNKVSTAQYIYIYIYTVQGNEQDGTYQYPCLYFALSETLDCPFEISPIISTLTNKRT
jgi:hypothetical protein